ncbi:alpha/beta fold hydrolase [Pontivivens ytuae]|uniref:Alpha/beta hydrolase n=1 Tax=Pontivivens ytuae TaxID=2789856 RepID=A0A7S9QD35_9RHOB|nr:alpha/beta hydrolase [Pontivivens ytuae]QPH54578.1 alpha/beta hydrolase [Pontivivens ytuae]
MIRETLLDIGGAPTRLLTSGPEDAPPLLFLHGFPESSLSWCGVMKALPEFRCLAFDQRGFGISRNPWPDLKGLAMPALLGDVAAVLDAGGSERVTLVGHDWGAAVAYAAAFALPHRIGRLVILNGVHPVLFQKALAAGGPQSAASQYIDWLRADGVEDTLRANNFEKLLGLFSAHMDMGWLTPELRAEYEREWSRPNAVEGMVSWYRVSPVEVAQPGAPIPLPAWAEAEMRVTMPHLLIWGLDDTALLPEAAEGLEALCEDLTRVELEGCDHWLHHQRPDAVARAIREWMSSRSSLGEA